MFNNVFERISESVTVLFSWFNLVPVLSRLFLFMMICRDLFPWNLIEGSPRMMYSLPLKTCDNFLPLFVCLDPAKYSLSYLRFS